MIEAASRPDRPAKPAARGAGWRLSAVLFADMVGYTAMTAADEVGVHALWSDFLARSMKPALARHGAAVVRTFGDGVLATFGAAASAVGCAEAIRRDILEARAAAAAPWPGLRLRMAINLCDVLHGEHDIHGDGVNLARRLQEHAAPDAIVLSENVRDALRNSLEGRVRDLGFLVMKGVGAPVRAWELTGPGAVERSAPQAEGELPSIAVLPFESIGAETSDLYFAEGVVEDVIVSLSGLRELVVISRSSTIAFRSRQVDPREARRVFGVRYVLQGSLRRRGPMLRLSATLTECETGATLFTVRRDFGQERLFEEQDRLVEEIVASIAPNIRQRELKKAMRKPPEVFSAYDALLQALHLLRRLDEDQWRRAGALLDMAIARDPGFSAPLAWKAKWWCVMVAQGWETDRAAAGRAAEAAARRAVELDEGSALALAGYGYVKAFLKAEFDEALRLHERARMVGPSHSLAWMLSSGTLAYMGRGREAVDCAEYALRLAPFDDILFTQYDWVSLAHYAAGSPREAARWAERALAEGPDHLPSLRLLAASRAAMGVAEGAQAAAARILAVAPAFRVSDYARSHRTFADEALQAAWLRDLRASGLPD